MADKRKRGQNFSLEEKDRLIKLLLEHKDTILNKRTDGATNESKCMAWTSITDSYNASGSTFRFPKDAKLKKKWLNTTGRKNWTPTKLSTICSQHFSENDILLTKKGYRYLKPSAVPTENVMKFLKKQPGSSTSAVKTETLDEPSTSDNIDDPPETGRESPSGLSDIGSDDLECALDTPLVTQLKQQLLQMKKQLKQKDQIIKAKDQKIEKLENAVTRLGERNKTMKLILLKMRRRVLGKKVPDH